MNRYGTTTLERMLVWASLAALALVLGCDRNAATFLLTPTGELPGSGLVSGRLNFGAGSFPRTLILLARVRDPNFNSTLSTIQVTGSITGNPSFDLTVAPHIRMLAPGVWVDTLGLASGDGEWKFVTDGAFDSPPDFGTPEGGRTDGLANTLLRGAAGPQGNLDANVPADFALPTRVVCTLDETTDPPTYAFEKIGEGSAVFSSTVDGTFMITGLGRGDYIMEVRPPELAPRRLTLTVGDGPLDLGDLDFTSGPTAAIVGTVSYDPVVFPDLGTPPFPPTTVKLFQGVTPIATEVAGRESNQFAFTALIPGTYRLELDALLFNTNTTINSVTVETDTVDVGTVTLTANTSEVSTGISVAGDFNNWDIGQLMGQNPLGVWTYTTPTPINSGTHNMKFVTDFNFDDPPDYGGDQTVTLTAPLIDEPVAKVSGEGTALSISFSTTDNYTFTLDERRQTFTIQPATATATEDRKAGTAKAAAAREAKAVPKAATARRRQR